MGKFWRLLAPGAASVLFSVTPSSSRSMAWPVLPKMRLAVIWLPTHEYCRSHRSTTMTPGPSLSVIRLPAAAVAPPIVLSMAPDPCSPSISTPPCALPKLSYRWRRCRSHFPRRRYRTALESRCRCRSRRRSIGRDDVGLSDPVPPIVFPELDWTDTPSSALPSATAPVTSVPILSPAIKLSFEPTILVILIRGKDIDPVLMIPGNQVPVVSHSRRHWVDPDPVA